MEKEKINNNGYEYVDLELPSGTLWATCNVGAKKPSEYGLYFQWGDTQGYSKEQVGKDKHFTCNDYKWINGSSFTKYTKPGSTLELEDDAAHVNMGGDWHMPTPEQFKELVNNTTSERTEQNSVKGTLFTSKKDSSKSIFIPAAGCAWGYSVTDIGCCGVLWTSMLDTYYVESGKYLLFTQKDPYLSFGTRYEGLSVRGVIDVKQNDTKDKNNNNNNNNGFIETIINDEVKKLQSKDILRIEKLIWEKYYNTCVKITTYISTSDGYLPYKNEYIYVRSVSINTKGDKDNITFRLSGQGFYYNDSDEPVLKGGNFSKSYEKELSEKIINDGTIKVDIISKDEYIEEAKKMEKFFSNNFEDIKLMI